MGFWKGILYLMEKKISYSKTVKVQDQVKRNKIILELPKCIQEAACSQAQISTVPKCLLIATLSLLWSAFIRLWKRHLLESRQYIFLTSLWYCFYFGLLREGHTYHEYLEFCSALKQRQELVHSLDSFWKFILCAQLGISCKTVQNLPVISSHCFRVMLTAEFWSLYKDNNSCQFLLWFMSFFLINSVKHRIITCG